MTAHLSCPGHGLATLSLICLWGALAGPGPAMAQSVMAVVAEETCLHPPMDPPDLDRIRRQGFYARLLEALADRCPEVALVFQEFEVGRVAGQPMRQTGTHDPFPPLGWPRPASPAF